MDVGTLPQSFVVIRYDSDDMFHHCTAKYWKTRNDKEYEFQTAPDALNKATRQSMLHWRCAKCIVGKRTTTTATHAVASERLATWLCRVPYKTTHLRHGWLPAAITPRAQVARNSNLCIVVRTLIHGCELGVWLLRVRQWRSVPHTGHLV